MDTHVSKTRIMIVDDEANVRETLGLAFEREGWEPQAFPDGAEAWAVLEQQLPAPNGTILVLDITMPRMDGLELCRRIRAKDEVVPILFLSSRDEEFDRVLGLELGADDYLCKPFSLRELCVRIKVLLRRRAVVASAVPGDSGAKSERIMVRGELSLDPEAFRAVFKGSEIKLTVSEFRILWELVSNPGLVRNREQLQLAAYPDDQYVNERAVDCHIKRIRRKLGLDGQAGDGPIETVYGLGYRFLE